MWNRPGRIKPSAPSVSHTPMNLMKPPGICDCAARAAAGITSFIPPAKRKRAAKTPWAIHSLVVDRSLRVRLIDVIVVSGSSVGLFVLYQHVEQGNLRSTRLRNDICDCLLEAKDLVSRIRSRSLTRRRTFQFR